MCEGLSIAPGTTREKRRVTEQKLDIVQMPFETALRNLSSHVGLAQRSLALRPAHLRRHLYVTCYTKGFSYFVTSMTAPVASGWSGRGVGLAPTGKRRLVTAHTLSERC
jgi:hypothetical protein